AFAEYQRSEAWTWEHMALTRARTICGPAAFRGKLEKLRLEVLKQPRDANRLLANVASMRARMAAAQKSPVPLWDLKLQRGGLVDLEFVVQYLLLRHGAGKPAILQSNPRQALAAIAKAKLLDAKTAALLSDAADFYATLLGVTRLAGKDEATDPERWPPALRLRLPKLVGEPDLDAVTARLAATQKAVHEIFQSLIETPAAPHLALADSLSAQQETSGEPS